MKIGRVCHRCFGSGTRLVAAAGALAGGVAGKQATWLKQCAGQGVQGKDGKKKGSC
jgi:hypothetical protein